MENKTASTTRNIIYNILDKNDLKDKLIFVTSDSASDLVACFKNIPEMKRIHCFAHRIHNSIISSINKSYLDKVVTKVNKIVSFINHSSKFYKKLKHFMTIKNYTDDIGKIKKVVQYVPTRWFSHYQMLLGYFSIVKYLREYLESNGLYKNNLFPSKDYDLVIKGLLNIFKLFFDFQYCLMKNGIGQITKVIFRIIFIERTFKEEIDKLLKSDDYVSSTVLLCAQYLLSIFKDKSFLDINKEEDKRRILSICNFLNPLNFNQKYNDADVCQFIDEINLIVNE